jgi:hypothetical protein
LSFRTVRVGADHFRLHRTAAAPNRSHITTHIRTLDSSYDGLLLNRLKKNHVLPNTLIDTITPKLAISDGWVRNLLEVAEANTMGDVVSV